MYLKNKKRKCNRFVVVHIYIYKQKSINNKIKIKTKK